MEKERALQPGTRARPTGPTTIRPQRQASSEIESFYSELAFTSMGLDRKPRLGRRDRKWRLLRPLPFFVSLLLPMLFPTTGLAAGPCGPPVTSVIACENSLPGDPPSDWQVNGIGDTSIQGFATSMSVNVGDTVTFKINTPASSYHIDILRLGYYGGSGARKIASNIQPSAKLPQSQPACLTNSTTGLIDCGNWGVSASWTVPSNAVSGIYIAHLVRNDTGGSSQIPFVVRDDSSHSDILLSTSDSTWEAYNAYGGNSLYTCTVSCPPGNPLAYKAAYAVSYNRPFDGAFTTDGGASYLFYAEYQMVRFLEANGFDVSYTTSSDVDRAGSLLLNHKLFVSSGHDEYWSAGQRANVTAARDAGVNLAFFSGNEVFWKTRWAPSNDGSNTPYRTLVTYKETHFDAPTDPQDPPTWTGTWRDPRFSPPGDGGKPENALTGQFFIVNSGTTDIQVPSQYAKLRFWRNTAAAKLTSGQTLTLGKNIGTLGYEWDEDPDNGFRPPGLLDMSSTTAAAQVFTDYGSTVANGTATHHLTLYRAPSGALVFGAGTVQWAWGLDDTNAWASSGPPGGSTPDPTMQQATVNLFADMGAQPASLLAGLTAASASSDTTPPTSTISSPARGAAIQDGASVTISGTATDAGGGVVAGVEVSTDGGGTWHPATLTTPAGASVNWSFSWIAHGNPTTTILSRAADDSGNIEAPSAGSSVTVNCPCSLWGTNTTPLDAVDSGDPNSTEVGMRFTTDTFGTITGMRFYKVSTNTGTHVGSLWSSSGQLLAQATFSGETGSGWQQVNFSQPVPVTPNTTYVVSYHAPSGHYTQTETYFYPNPAPEPDGGSIVDSAPLHALRSSGSSVNGVFAYSSGSTFPTSTYNAENYWVDPVFSPSGPPGQVTGVSAVAGNASANVSWSAPSTGGPSTSYVVTPYIGTTAQSTTTVTGSPAPTSAKISGLTNGTAYTFTVTAVNPNGSGPPSAASNAVTPSSAIVTPAFVQQATGHTGGAASLAVTPPGNITAGNRLIVLAGVWSAAGATTSSVTDSAGNSYVELLHFKASDGTEMSVWSAPIISGGGTRPAVSVKTTSSADIGAAVSEYSGLSPVSDASVVDQMNTASGTTSGAASVASGATPATTSGNDLALGMYIDSGFGNALTPGAGYTQRANISGASDMDLLSEDQLLPSSGATPNATVGTGLSTVWLMATVALKAATASGPTAPAAPTGVSATAGNGSATVSWSAPANGGSPITSYTITPYIGTTAQTSTTITGSPPSTSTTITGLTNGTAYTFTVTATNSIGTGSPSSASTSVTPTAPTAPAAPTGVAATAGNGTATVSWTAPSNGGSPITSYTITPFIGLTAQTPTTISGSPPATSTTISGLTNGTTYTFVVTATNAVGTGPPSATSNAVTPTAATPTPAFVQQVSKHSTAVTSVAVTPASNITAGNRIVVLVGIWASTNPTAKTVTDSAGNTYVEVLHFKASDGTEMSVWTAPITKGGGTKPTITVTPTAKADVGVAALEYSGLSTVADATAVDQTATNTGATGSAGAVSSGATPATTAGNELALGLYADSGFGDSLTAGNGFTSRTNVSNTSDIELLAEDQLVALGAKPNASAGTGASTTWLMSTVIFKHG